MATCAPPYLLLLLLQLPFFIITAQINGNIIRVRSSDLTAGGANSSWLSSPSQDFAFGFHQLDDNSFLLSIWYHKLRPEITTVWYANGENPAPRNSKLELTADRGLVLTDPQGFLLWSSGKTESSAPVSYAVMNDTGNLVLMDASSKPIWESFNHPTDTLLPTQIMKTGDLLYSRKSHTNFSRGRFQFCLREVGNVVLNTKLINDVYFEVPSNQTFYELNPVIQVIFNQSGYLYALHENGDRSNIIIPGDRVPDLNTTYQRVSLSYDGVLISSYHYKDPSTADQSWYNVKSKPEGICGIEFQEGRGTGPCGYNSICTTQSDGRPDCKCPTGYAYIDPTYVYSGCKTNYLDGCESHHDYLMREIPDTDWPLSDYEFFEPITKENCTKACLHDCVCAAVIFAGDKCWKKKLPLSNGKGRYGTTAFLKLRDDYSSTPAPPTTPNLSDRPDPKDHDGNLIIVLSTLLGSSVFVNFMLVGGIFMALFFDKKNLVQDFANESSVKNNLQKFTYNELTQATNGFKEELGRGSCGIVYKGKTKSNGLIAVKMLDRVFEDCDREFKAEVNVIGQTHHRNLVRLVGYCDEKQHRLLVYEFLRNGTLSKFLFGDPKPSWKQRTEIAFGIARGLVYLHEECSTQQIIHCDIKPQNILLDEYYNARISDFGLAKLLLINQSHTKTNIRGTKGYVAPDWFRSAPVSVKVDVYSFGVVLLEIICCRRNVDMKEVDDAGQKRVLTDYAYDCVMEGKLHALIENDMEALDDIKMVERFVMIAFWCLQEDPNVKPNMKKVLLMLEGMLQVSVPPTPFSFTSISAD